MTNITIVLSDAQYKGLQYVAIDAEGWAENAVLNRIRIATEEIVQAYTSRALDEGIQIPATRDEIVTDAFARGWVKTAADRGAEDQAALAERA